jgi:hypothetical protein
MWHQRAIQNEPAAHERSRALATLGARVERLPVAPAMLESVLAIHHPR